MFGDGALGVHFYKKIVPPMEPSNWSRVYSSPTNKVISAHFTRNNCLLVGSFKAIFIRFRILKYKQFFKCPNKVSTFNTKQNLCIPKDNK
jgi:hypothetical protein